MTFFLLTAIVIGAAMFVMAVGVVFSDRCLRGSCGGPDLLGPNGEPLSCDTCPKRHDLAETPPSNPRPGGRVNPLARRVRSLVPHPARVEPSGDRVQPDLARFAR